MSLPQSMIARDKGLSAWCILHGYRGSIAHGILTSWRLSRTVPVVRLGYWQPVLGARYVSGSGGDDFRDWLDDWGWEQ